LFNSGSTFWWKKGKTLEASNVKGTNKLLAFVMLIYGSDSLEEGAPLTTQERRAYLSHAYRLECPYIVMQFYEKKESESRPEIALSGID
jgi:hypothetical protein